MSVNRHGDGWQVKNRAGGRGSPWLPSRTFRLKGDATDYDAEVKRRKRLGPAFVAELDRDG